MPRWIQPRALFVRRLWRLNGSILGWDGFWWVTGTAAITVIEILLSWLFWKKLDNGESLSTTIRRGLVVGGVIAIVFAV